MGRGTLAVLSTENLVHNAHILRTRAPHARMMVAVKANAYGHGLRSVAQRLTSIVDAFGVVSIDEALALRSVGIKNEIIILEGVHDADDFLRASCERFTLVIHDHAQIARLKSCVLPLPLRVWIKVDTGLGRLGFMPDELQGVCETLMALPFVERPIGLMSHFACADVPGHPLTIRQLEIFEACARLHEGPKSICNSAALFSTPGECRYDLIRPGIALYGIAPCENIAATAVDLLPVMTLQTKVISVRDVPAGHTIGYGARYCTAEPMRIAIVAIGYGDGYPRSAPDGTPVLIQGVRCPLIGRVSMDKIAVDVSHMSSVQVGDQVIVWGDGLPVEEIARYAQRSPYELMTAVQFRVKFYWTRA